MFATEVPYFISILFLIAFIVPVILISNLLTETSQQNRKSTVLLFFIGYLILVSALCFAGVFDVVSLPPRIILVTTLPLLLFYLLVVSNTAFNQTFLKEVKLTSLVNVHIFRFIGSFFLILLYFDQLPRTFALIAGLGDVITASSSIFIAKAIQQEKPYARNIALLWNTFGLVDIFITSAMAIYLTQQNILFGTLGVDILAKFPFCFIPAFAPATIIFLHVSIYRKILSKKFK